MKQCQKEILKQKMQDLRDATLEKWRDNLDELVVSGDFMDEEFSDRQNMLQFRIKSREKFFLQKIENTLEKIDQEEFGHCQECDEEINFKRLLARPMAEKCITCKEIEERQEGNILYEKKSRTLGQTITNMNDDNVVFLGTKRSASKQKVKKFEVVMN